MECYNAVKILATDVYNMVCARKITAGLEATLSAN